MKSSEDMTLVAPLDPARQKMIFRYEYRNNARLFQQQGWYMNRLGEVYKYKYERVLDSPRASEIKFRLKFKVRPTLIARVSRDVVAEKTALIKKIKTGSYKEKSTADEAGIGTISAFSASEKAGEYREIKLETHGDFEGKNNAPEAKALLDWLFKVIPEYTF